MGVGMIAVVAPDRVAEVEWAAAAADLASFDCGYVRTGDEGVRLDDV
jgi:hypothetical protein